MVSLGEKITALRKQKGWTQEILADKVGVVPNHVSRWEKNRVRPATKTIKVLAQLFGVTLDELINNEQPVPQTSPQDRVLYEKFQQVKELPPEERDMVFHIIETFATQKRVLQMLGGQVGK